MTNESLMPIEVGCLAITFNSANPINDGKIVTVGRFLGENTIFSGKNYWEVDKLMYGNRSGSAYAHRESCLLRIDGHQPTKDEIESTKHNSGVAA